MSHQVSYYEGVLTVRLDGRLNAQEVIQDLRTNLDSQAEPVTIILDLTLAASFDQQLKSLFYRVFQHHNVSCVGICSANPEVVKDVNDLVTILRKVRTVVVAETETDLRTELGLGAPAAQQKKLSGILAYLKKD